VLARRFAYAADLARLQRPAPGSHLLVRPSARRRACAIWDENVGGAARASGMWHREAASERSRGRFPLWCLEPVVRLARAACKVSSSVAAVNRPLWRRMVSTNGRFFRPTDAALRSLAFGKGGKRWR
jgi:hypothetical protein